MSACPAAADVPACCEAAFVRRRGAARFVVPSVAAFVLVRVAAFRRGAATGSSTSATLATTVPAMAWSATSATTVPAMARSAISATTVPAMVWSATSATTVPVMARSATSAITVPARTSPATSVRTLPAPTVSATDAPASWILAISVIPASAMAGCRPSRDGGVDVPSCATVPIFVATTAGSGSRTTSRAWSMPGTPAPAP